MRVLAGLTALLVVAGCSSAGPGTPSGSGRAGEEESALHVECLGDAGPTVVVIAGLNTSGSNFLDLQSRVSPSARTCIYDRAGIAESPPLDAADPDPSPGSAAADLRTALVAEGIDPPYVVVGWSYGGMVAQALADEFPDDVAGLVLEDTSVREQFTPDAVANASDPWEEGGRPIDADAVRDQLADVDLGDLPVVVLSQDVQGRWARPWYRAHDRVALASTDSVRAVGVGSGHAMHLDVPEVLERAVDAVWTAAVDGTSLPSCREAFRGLRVRCRD